MIIDAHVHIGRGLLHGWTKEACLLEMDRLGVQLAVAVPWDQAIAVDHAAGNDAMLELCFEFPDRFIPFCTVNPWFGDKALSELKRAIRQGAKGLKLHPVYQGFQLTDPHVLPVLRVAVDAGVPIYIPTGTPVMNMPLQLKYIAQLFTDGVFIQGHFGSTDFWIDAVPSVMDCPNVYIDTSYNLVSSIKKAISMVGAERVIYSSDAPYLSMEGELEKFHWLDLPEDQKGLILGGNIKRLLQGGK